MTSLDELIMDAYARYDADKRTNGMYDFEAYFDALMPLLQTIIAHAEYYEEIREWNNEGN